jgi:cytochrome c5
VRVVAVLLAAALLATGCATTALPRPTEANAQAAQARWPDASLAELDKGRSIYLAKCSACHDPERPQAHAAAEWPGLVAKMRDRAGLDDDEARLVERYVVTLATP